MFPRFGWLVASLGADFLRSAFLSALLSSAAVASFTASLAAALVFAVGLAAAQGELGGCHAVGQVHLGADGVGQVGYYQNVLDVVVAGVVSRISTVKVSKTYKSRSISAGSTLGANARVLRRN